MFPFTCNKLCQHVVLVISRFGFDTQILVLIVLVPSFGLFFVLISTWLKSVGNIKNPDMFKDSHVMRKPDFCS